MDTHLIYVQGSNNAQGLIFNLSCSRNANQIFRENHVHQSFAITTELSTVVLMKVHVLMLGTLTIQNVNNV